MEFGLEEKIIAKINNVFKKYPQVFEVILYGSRAKGNFKNGSDVDLVLIGNRLDLSLLYKIRNEIDDLLLPYSFDISILNLITNENLLEHINRAGKIFYRKVQGV